MGPRILFIHDKGPQGGGTRTQVDRATDQLRRAGHDVERLRLGTAMPDDRGDHSTPCTSWPHQALANGGAFLREVEARRPDIVHLQGCAGSLAPGLVEALARRWPVVATLHDVGLFCMNGLRLFRRSDDLCQRQAGAGCWTSGCWRPSGSSGPALAVAHLASKRAQRLAWLSACQVTVPSASLADLALGHGARPDRLSVVPNICEIGQTPPIAENARPHALFVGAISRAKGADLALEALSFLPGRDWSATFVGDGPDRAELEARCRALAYDNVTFTGWRPADEVEQLRACSTVCLFTSRTIESFGLGGAESLACGRPVVGIARGGTAEWLVDGVTGLSVEEPDAAKIGRRLAELLFDNRRARWLGEAGRSLVRSRFSGRAYTERMSGIYASAVTGASREIHHA